MGNVRVPPPSETRLVSPQGKERDLKLRRKFKYFAICSSVYRRKSRRMIEVEDFQMVLIFAHSCETHHRILKGFGLSKRLEQTKIKDLREPSFVGSLQNSLVDQKNIFSSEKEDVKVSSLNSTCSIISRLLRQIRQC